jgi:hypothetical protein
MHTNQGVVAVVKPALAKGAPSAWFRLRNREPEHCASTAYLTCSIKKHWKKRI